jgi:hypothetical protein
MLKLPRKDLQKTPLPRWREGMKSPLRFNEKIKKDGMPSSGREGELYVSLHPLPNPPPSRGRE